MVYPILYRISTIPNWWCRVVRKHPQYQHVSHCVFFTFAQLEPAISQKLAVAIAAVIPMSNRFLLPQNIGSTLLWAPQMLLILEWSEPSFASFAQPLKVFLCSLNQLYMGLFDSCLATSCWKKISDVTDWKANTLNPSCEFETRLVAAQKTVCCDDSTELLNAIYMGTPKFLMAVSSRVQTHPKATVRYPWVPQNPKLIRIFPLKIGMTGGCTAYSYMVIYSPIPDSHFNRTLSRDV